MCNLRAVGTRVQRSALARRSLRWGRLQGGTHTEKHPSPLFLVVEPLDVGLALHLEKHFGRRRGGEHVDSWKRQIITDSCSLSFKQGAPFRTRGARSNWLNQSCFSSHPLINLLPLSICVLLAAGLWVLPPLALPQKSSVSLSLKRTEVR